MKWKNIDVGASYYYVTGTFTEWLPLLANGDVRTIVCCEITKALNECSGFVSAFVLMPDHVHLLLYLPEGGRLHRFNMLWRGRSARLIARYAKQRGSTKILETMARHANGKSRYAVWKEQVRSLPIHSEKKLRAMVDTSMRTPCGAGL